LLDRARKAYSRFDNVKPFWILPNQRSGSGRMTRSPGPDDQRNKFV